MWEKAKGELPRGATKSTVQLQIESLVGEKAEQFGLPFMKAKVKPGMGQIEIVTSLGGAENLPRSRRCLAPRSGRSL